YLSSLGHEPARISGNNFWYHSPLHADKMPSFKINRQLNKWYDFAGSPVTGNYNEMQSKGFGRYTVKLIYPIFENSFSITSVGILLIMPPYKSLHGRVMGKA